MANKKKIEERLKVQQRKKTERIIQWVGGGIILLVIIGSIWLLLPGRSSNVVEVPTDIPPLEEVPLNTPEPGFTPAATPTDSGYKQYPEYPPMTIDPAKKYFAKFIMEKGGEFTIQLFPDKAPLAVNSFVFLARDGFYDGVTFHRVLPDFMAQGGDPSGTGMGGPGYEFANEDSDLTFDKEGVLAMANAGRDTNGSQFFITFGPQEYLNGGYTIFGEVTEGMDVVKSITLRDPEQNPDYSGDVVTTIDITEE